MRTLVFAILTLLFLLPLSTSAQDARLAQQYYQNGEYEKAAVMFERLYRANETQDFYYDRYIECLLSLQQYEEAEKSLKKELKKYPERLSFSVGLGNLYERQLRIEEANEEYERAVKNLPADRGAVIKLAQSFTQLAKYDLAIATYEKGARLLADDGTFSYNLGELYRRQGDSPRMIESYLNSLRDNPGILTSLQTIFQRYFSNADFDELQTQLYTRIQEEEDAIFYVELLGWVFIQRKDYANALRQVKSLDRRLKENGFRVFQFAETVANDKYYDVAIDAYAYIITENGPGTPIYVESKRQLLRCKREKLVQDYVYTQEELLQLEQEYLVFLDEFGRNRNTAPIILELSELDAYYLNDLEKAILLLQEMVAMPGIQQAVQARGKIALADYYLIRGERWDATLLYSQVDKAFEDDVLGHEARFRNAKLSYYFGDFEWAQAQFEVLKASTSKLIANDALDLSVFIMDNLGLDSTTTSLTLYAEADLLIFQNRFDEAFAKLDSLLSQFPEHSLQDDVLYAKAQVFRKKRDYPSAAALLQTIVDEHKEEIRADNALFELATLHELYLGNPEKAKELYEKLFLDFSNSTFAVEARKRFRILRGDDI
ncbi:MAG: tetratricopeptide repeat protein [Saprospirales bacterium]|nr:tetratricopeptide repeat protein [Saprospirales bacterium]